MIKIRLEFATKTYKRGNENVHVLDNGRWCITY